MKHFINITFLFCILFNIAAFSQTQITNRVNWEYHPKWHPANADTIFYTYNNTNDSIDIYMYVQSTGMDYMLPIDKEGALHFDITPDGNKIIFDAREDINSPINLYSLNLLDSTIQLIKDNARYPCISPDGSKIAFVNSVDSKMYIANTDGSNEQVLTNLSTYYEVSDWSPDGSKIALTIEQNQNSDIWIVNSDGTGLYQLTTNPNRDYSPSWSPDGQRIVFTSVNSGNYDLWLINIDGTNLTQLTTHISQDSHSEWSSDSSKIIFASTRSGAWDIWEINVSTNNITKLRRDNEFKVYPNPTDGNISIELFSGRSGNAVVTVYSENGKVVSEEQVKIYEDGTAVLNLKKGGKLSSGLYLMNIVFQNKTMSKMITIK